ncbi:Two-component response regulator [Labilithrix luteola]|uniref:Two-component response regulator n=1 Tax=Labilithrix luteola TaxID=1391654 RepID=A0A0K1PSD0_9BACT|nr:Two-component response regulator [Labilithrix luteola]
MAEDDDAMRTLVAEVLRAEDYDVIEAADGRELFWHVERALADGGLDLVISDVRMPVYTGLDVVEAWTGFRGPRILLMTAFADPELRQRVTDLGIVLLDKPFPLGTLLDLVNETVTERGHQ